MLPTEGRSWVKFPDKQEHFTQRRKENNAIILCGLCALVSVRDIVYFFRLSDDGLQCAGPRTLGLRSRYFGATLFPMHRLPRIAHFVLDNDNNRMYTGV